MDTTTKELMDLARRLLTFEASEELPDRFALSFSVCQKLREPLVKLAGAEGFRALLSRALSLAKIQNPILGSLRVSTAGVLEVADPAPLQGAPQEWHDAEVNLVGQLLGLLATFIGLALTLHLVEGVWPQVTQHGIPSRDIS